MPFGSILACKRILYAPHGNKTDAGGLELYLQYNGKVISRSGEGTELDSVQSRAKYEACYRSGVDARRFALYGRGVRVQRRRGKGKTNQRCVYSNSRGLRENVRMPH